jgi:hypothetical protein
MAGGYPTNLPDSSPEPAPLFSDRPTPAAAPQAAPKAAPAAPAPTRVGKPDSTVNTIRNRSNDIDKFVEGLVKGNTGQPFNAR